MKWCPRIQSLGNCSIQDPWADVNPCAQASISFDICPCDGHPAHRWGEYLDLHGLAASAGCSTTGSTVGWYKPGRIHSTAWHGSDLLRVVPAPVLFSCRGSTSSTSQPRWDFSSPLKYRLCGVCPCQRTEQFCASSWADPMQLTLVNHTHVLDRSRNQMRNLCYCLVLPMELPHQLRKLLFLGWSLLVLLLL